MAGEILKIPERYTLKYLHVAGGSGIRPTATVAIEEDGEERVTCSLGAGPVDAAFQAVKKLVQTRSTLLRYNVQSITGGTDALGKVTVRLRDDDVEVNGQGADPDIITASVKAYLNALNRLEYMKQ